MEIKRYFASNMRSALDMIKQAQGPDVLILSNRKVDGGVELITADELTEQEAERLAQQTRKAPRPDLNVPEKAPADEDDALPVVAAPLLPAEADTRDYLWTDAGVVEQMREELGNLKGLLEYQLSGLAWSKFGSRHPLRARLLRVLNQVGICPALAHSLVAEVPENFDYRAAWQRVLALLVVRIRALDDPIVRHGGVIALLGPTGVGKSTIASKLAAQFALEFGSEKVAIVSMDDRRLGAHQQMKAFGRLIGAAVYVARDVEELNPVLDDLGSRRLVVIDTPGNAPDDARYYQLAADLLNLGSDIQTYNVLSATTDYLAATKLLAVIGDLALTGCILTKIDEAATLGPSLSAIVEADLPLAYTSAGQRVPDNLDLIDVRALVERTIELAKTSPAPDDRAAIERAFTA